MAVLKKKKHLKEYCKFIDAFFFQHRELWAYYRSNRTNNDITYFSEQFSEFDSVDIGLVNYDGNCHLSNSNIIASGLAYEKMTEYICSRHQELEECFSDLSNKVEALVFKGNKIDLVELGYALYHSNTCDNDIKEIMEALELVFDIELDNYYRTFHSIKRRKKEKATFLLKLQKAIQSLDE